MSAKRMVQEIAKAVGSDAVSVARVIIAGDVQTWDELQAQLVSKFGKLEAKRGRS